MILSNRRGISLRLGTEMHSISSYGPCAFSPELSELDLLNPDLLKQRYFERS